MYCRAFVLSLLLFALGSRPVEAAIITITGATPKVIYSGYEGQLREALFGDELLVSVSGLYFESNLGMLARVWSTDVYALWLIPRGSRLLSADVSGTGPFWVNDVLYDTGRYLIPLGLGRLSFTAPGALWDPYGPPDRPLTVWSVTLDDLETVPEPSLTLLMLVGGAWVARRSWTRRRGRAAIQ